ncbi:MAG: AAA family ATPase [Deltaproteobacteria bacterium]|nr:AAA family ATPase [Deltaproteobacteria bacterium]
MKPLKIAISGKGGVGKTTIMAILAQRFTENFDQVLVIDADPSPHMAETLGITNAGDITPIAEMRELLVERSGKTAGSPFYNINPKIDDLPKRFMLEKDGLRLMVLGAVQTGDSGCACAENTVLRRLLVKLLLTDDQAVLLDMEAGVEHLGRGTIAGVDHLLIVVIPSKSSVRTAMKIRKLAREVGIPRISFIGNNINDAEDESFLQELLPDRLIAVFPNASAIRQAERAGTPVAPLAVNFPTPLDNIMRVLQGEIDNSGTATIVSRGEIT